MFVLYCLPVSLGASWGFLQPFPPFFFPFQQMWLLTLHVLPELERVKRGQQWSRADEKGKGSGSPKRKTNCIVLQFYWKAFCLEGTPFVPSKKQMKFGQRKRSCFTTQKSVYLLLQSFFFKKKIFCFMCMRVLPTCVWLRYPGAGPTESCELPYVCQELNLDPLEEQLVCFASELPLQPQSL